MKANKFSLPPEASLRSVRIHGIAFHYCLKSSQFKGHKKHFKVIKDLKLLIFKP